MKPCGSVFSFQERFLSKFIKKKKKQIKRSKLRVYFIWDLQLGFAALKKEIMCSAHIQRENKRQKPLNTESHEQGKMPTVFLHSTDAQVSELGHISTASTEKANRSFITIKS